MYAVLRETSYAPDESIVDSLEFREFREFRQAHARRRGYLGTIVTEVDGGRFLTLTLWDRFDIHHYAFKVSEAAFDTIFSRIQAEGILYGSEPHSRDDRTINHRDGGPGVYFHDPNGHILELLARDSTMKESQ